MNVEEMIDRLLLRDHLWIGHDGTPANPPSDAAKEKAIAAVWQKVMLVIPVERLAEHTPVAVWQHVTARFNELVDHGTAAQVLEARAE